MKPPLGPNESAVFAVLQHQHRPLSAYQILEHLHGTNIRAAVQVYRALEKLTLRGTVHRLESLSAFVACDCAHGASSPGFMLCTCCGDVREFDAGKTVSAVQNKLKDFKIETPGLELKGLCANCQATDHLHEVQP